MKAVRITRHGKPEVLTVETIADPAVGEGDALVRIEAASINPSDVKNVQGAMAQTTLPRTPGRDFAGVVEVGPAGWIGAKVWGTGGDVGFTRDGSHAEAIVVPVSSLRRKPEALNFDQAASVGVNFITAWKGLVDGAALCAGETVLIIAASGGVGNAGVQIARRIGARIIGTDRRPPRPGAAIAATLIAGETTSSATNPGVTAAGVATSYVTTSSVTTSGTATSGATTASATTTGTATAGAATTPDVLSLVADGADIPLAVRQATGGRGADVVLDCVGGVMFRHALACLAPRGRLVEMSVTGAREVTFNLADFYHNESRLIGIDTLKWDLTASAQVLEQLRPGFEAGDYRPAAIAGRFALEDAVAAYQEVAAGGQGRVVLLPGR